MTAASQQCGTTLSVTSFVCFLSFRPHSFASPLKRIHLFMYHCFVCHGINCFWNLLPSFLDSMLSVFVITVTNACYPFSHNHSEASLLVERKTMHRSVWQ